MGELAELWLRQDVAPLSTALSKSFEIACWRGGRSGEEAKKSRENDILLSEARARYHAARQERENINYQVPENKENEFNLPPIGKGAYEYNRH